MTLKICIVSPDYLPHVGGIAAHVHELSKSLVEMGNCVHVITVKNSIYDKQYENIDGINVHRIYFPHNTFVNPLIYSFLEGIKINSLIKKEGIEIIHFHNVHIPSVFRLHFFKNIPKIQTEHSSGFLQNVENGKHVQYYKYVFNHVDYVIGPSVELVNTFIKIGVDPRKVTYISNAVDIRKFNPFVGREEIRNKYDINNETKIILCSRRLEPKNGVYYFIKCIPEIVTQTSNIKCLIVGAGSEMERIQNEASELKINDKVIFAEEVPNSEMPKYYAASDIAVLPSLKEATSIAGLEALASGIPLVGTNVGGIPQIIEDNVTGLLVSPRNPKELAMKLISLLLDDEKRLKMGFNARKTCEKHFSWDIIAKEILEIYNQALEKHT